MKSSGLTLDAIQDTTLLGVPGDFQRGETSLLKRLQQLSGRKPFKVKPIPPTAEELAKKKLGLKGWFKERGDIRDY